MKFESGKPCPNTIQSGGETIAEKIIRLNRDKVDYSIILWKSLEQPPEEVSYVLTKCVEEDGLQISCTVAAYEGGKFLYFYPDGDVKEISRSGILGWSYYPYDDRLTE